MPPCKRIFCCIFGWYFYIKIRLQYEKPLCCPALELFYCLPLWKTMVFVSSRAFSLSIPHFFVVYTFGKQWGYMEKSYKMQQTFLHTRCSNNYKSSQRLRKLSTSCEILNINCLYINQYKWSILNLQKSLITQTSILTGTYFDNFYIKAALLSLISTLTLNL